MKKLLFFAAFAFLFSNAINAQDEATQSNDQGFSFGLKAGVNLASISNLDKVLSGGDTSGRTSFHVGALGEYSFNEKFSVQAELLYSELGGKYEDDYSDYELRGGGSYSEEGTIKLSYLSMPLLAKYYITPGFSVEAGPQFSFNLSAKLEGETTYTMGDETDTESYDEDLDEIQTVDVGGAVGLTYELDLGLFFSARYVFGLSKISNVGDEYIDDYDEYFNSSKNNVFQLSAGYKFN